MPIDEVNEEDFDDDIDDEKRSLTVDTTMDTIAPLTTKPGRLFRNLPELSPYEADTLQTTSRSPSDDTMIVMGSDIELQSPKTDPSLRSPSRSGSPEPPSPSCNTAEPKVIVEDDESLAVAAMICERDGNQSNVEEKIVNKLENESDEVSELSELKNYHPVVSPNDLENVNGNAQDDDTVDTVDFDWNSRSKHCNNMSINGILLEYPMMKHLEEDVEDEQDEEISISNLSTIQVAIEGVAMEESVQTQEDGYDEYMEQRPRRKFTETEEELSRSDSISILQSDLILPQDAGDSVGPAIPAIPTMPMMQAPRPMQSTYGMKLNVKPGRRYSYTPCVTRKDLHLDHSSADTTTSSGSDAHYPYDDSSCSSSSTTMSDDTDDALSDHNDIDTEEIESVTLSTISSVPVTPSGSKGTRPRSADILDELRQRKSAMDAHYIVPHRCRHTMHWCLAVVISVIAITLLVIGCRCLDRTATPSVSEYGNFGDVSRIRSQCENVTNVMVVPQESYLMEYGYIGTSTGKGEHYDGWHWVILSVINLGGMMLIYAVILAVNAVFMVFRYSYHYRNQIDPLFCWSCCPHYYKYSSPNAPKLSSVLDPNRMQLFNRGISSGITPRKREHVAGASTCGGGVGVLPVVNEEDTVSGSDIHSLVEEPVRFDLPESSSDDDAKREEEDVRSLGLDEVQPIGGDEEKDGNEEVKNVWTGGAVRSPVSLSQFAHQHKATIESIRDSMNSPKETESSVLKDTLMSLHARDESMLSTATDDTVVIRPND